MNCFPSLPLRKEEKRPTVPYRKKREKEIEREKKERESETERGDKENVVTETLLLMTVTDGYVGSGGGGRDRGEK